MQRFEISDHYDLIHDGVSWSVNDSQNWGHVDIPAGCSDNEILRALFDAGYLMSCPDSGTGEFEVDGDDKYISVDGPLKDGHRGPYCSLYFKEDICDLCQEESFYPLADHDGRKVCVDCDG